MYKLTGRKLFVSLATAVILMTAGCNSGTSAEKSYNFVSTYFEASECSDAYWMLERDGERFFVLDSDMLDTPAHREWRQNGRPNDGVGTDIPSTDAYYGGLTVPTIRVGFTTDLLALMTYTELWEVALPNDWFDENGNCTNWPEPPVEPEPEVPYHEHALPEHNHAHEHDVPYHEHDADDDCEEDDDNGHGNDCDHDDDDNPGNGPK